MTLRIFQPKSFVALDQVSVLSHHQWGIYIQKNWPRPVFCVEIWLGGIHHTFMAQRIFFSLKKKPVYNETQDRMEQIPPKKLKNGFFQSLLLKNHSVGFKQPTLLKIMFHFL